MRYLNKKISTIILVIYMVLSTNVLNVLATAESGTPDASSVVQPIFTIINLFVVAMQAVGAFLFVKGLSELATSLRREDDSGVSASLKTLIAGLILISIRLMLQLCGVSLG